MKKRLLTAFIILLSVMTVSCGKDENSSKASLEEPLPSVSVSEENEASLEVSTEISASEDIPDATINDAPDLDTTITMYADFLKNLYESKPDSMFNLRYSIVYADDDDTPELVYMEDSYHAASVHMCFAYKDGVYEVGEFGEYGSFAYVPRGSRIISFYMNQGVYMYDFYSIKDRTLQEDRYFEIMEAEEDTDTVYYIDGDVVDKDAFDAAYAEANNYKFETCEYYGAFSYMDSYDVYDILYKYATTGIKPPTVKINDDVKEAAGHYSAMAFGEYGMVATDTVGTDIYCDVDVSEDGYLTIKYGNGEASVEDVNIPITAFYDALSTIEEGSLFAVTAMNDSLTREYTFHYMPDGSAKLLVFDGGQIFDNSSFYFLLAKLVE